MPPFMAEVVAELSQIARESPHLNQRSGVSVRLTIANYETLAANAVRRALRNGETEAVPRISDLQALVSSTQGKVEVESMEEGREEVLLQQLASAAVLLVFRRRVVIPDAKALVASFTEETVVHAGDDLPASVYADTLAELPLLVGPVLALAGSEDPGVVASAVEFVLEGLHLTKRLNKEAAGPRATYRGRG
jgi:magnesium chelatase subunit I